MSDYNTKAFSGAARCDGAPPPSSSFAHTEVFTTFVA